MSHTPGPYTFEELGTGRYSGGTPDGLGYIYGPDGETELCHHGNEKLSREENIANGELFARAPYRLAENERLRESNAELLALVIQYRDDLRHPIKDQMSVVRRVEAVDRALAKHQDTDKEGTQT